MGRIAVVGGGVGGLAAAAALQRRGLDVTVVEARPDTSAGAGITLWPNALAALDAIGLGDAVRAAGHPVAGGAIRWRDGSWLRRGDPARLVDLLGEPMVAIRRGELLGILGGALRPGTVRAGAAVAAIAETGDGMRVGLAGGGHLDAAAVVGADGTGSVVARWVGGAPRYRYAGYTAWRGVASLEIDPALAGETLGPAVQFGHVPLGERLTYWFATGRAPRGASQPAGEVAALRRRFGRWAHPVPALLAATDEADVLRHDVVDRVGPRRWSRGRAAVIGDAAHAMRPHLGQGGCQALEDAALLPAFLLGAAEDELPAALARFADFRRPRVRAVVAGSALLGRALHLRPAAVSAALARATVMLPDRALYRVIGAAAGRQAFAAPDATRTAR